MQHWLKSSHRNGEQRILEPNLRQDVETTLLYLQSSEYLGRGGGGGLDDKDKISDFGFSDISEMKISLVIKFKIHQNITSWKGISVFGTF